MSRLFGHVFPVQGAAWHRCRLHAKRNLLAVATHSQRAVISALISTVFAQPDAEAAREPPWPAEFEAAFYAAQQPTPTGVGNQ